MSLNSQQAVVSHDLSSSSLSVQSKHDVQMDKPEDVDQKNVDWTKMCGLEERLRAETEERNELEREIQRLRQERDALEERKQHESGGPVGQQRRIISDYGALTFHDVTRVGIMQMLLR